METGRSYLKISKIAMSQSLIILVQLAKIYLENFLWLIQKGDLVEVMEMPWK